MNEVMRWWTNQPHFSTCDFSLRYFFFLTAGFKMRKRQIINEPTGGPANCPHLVEAVPCEEPSCYEWQLVSLDKCVPDGGQQCGPGTQVPRVQCINSNGEKLNPLRSCWVAKLSGLVKQKAFLLRNIIKQTPANLLPSAEVRPSTWSPVFLFQGRLYANLSVLLCGAVREEISVASLNFGRFSLQTTSIPPSSSPC